MRSLSQVILASASPRRKELLTSLGLAVTVMPSGYDEPPFPELRPAELAERHAAAKSAALAARYADDLVIAADTVVDIDGESLGKPRDADEAARMLRRLSGREHLVHTAVSLSLGSQRLARLSTTRVTFYTLTNEEIRAYSGSEEPLDKAGAYGIQGRGAALVERIDGDFYTVMGFPIALFVRSLGELGLTLAAGQG